jgi:MFS family permease
MGIKPDAAVPATLKVTLLVIATLTIMAGTIVAPSLPAIRQAFIETPHVDLLSRMVLTLPAIFVATFAPLVGTLADRHGRKRLLVAAILLYAIAGASGLAAPSLTGVLIGRAALGLAIGAIMTIGAALVGDYFQGSERERYLGLQQACTQIGGVAFVIAGGLLADVSWRAPFAVYGLALIILPAAMLFLTEPVSTGKSGAGPITCAAAAFPWRSVSLVCLVAFLINALFYTIPAQLPFFLRELGLERPSIAGWAIGALNAASAATALSYGRLRAHLRIVPVFAVSLALMAAGYLVLSFATAAAGMFAAVAIVGLGLGFAMPNIMSAAIQLAPPAGRGRVTGLVTSSMFLGHFVSPIASQPLIARAGFDGTYSYVALTLVAMTVATLAVLVLSRPVRGAAL